MKTVVMGIYIYIRKDGFFSFIVDSNGGGRRNSLGIKATLTGYSCQD